MSDIEFVSDVVSTGSVVATLESSVTATLISANRSDGLGLTEAQISKLARELAKNAAQPVLLLEVQIAAR